MTGDDEIDGLAAEYVLGSLGPIERKEIDSRREIDAALDDAIKAWEARLAPLSHLLPGIAPPPQLFFEIEKRLHEPQGRQIVTRARARRPRRWPAIAAGACALAACLAIVIVWFSPNSSASPARLFAELQRNGNLTNGTNPTVPLGFVVYFDLRASTMVISPFAVPPGSRGDYQLWLVPRDSAPPISLGVISLAEPTTSAWLATYPPYNLVNATLTVSLEPAGGAPKGIPTGPTVFVGTLVQTMP
jgi:anti-sigma-K factor RskA